MKLSFQRFSMLGLVLLGVSAVTAAVLPSNNKSDAGRREQGSLTTSADNVGGVSCTPTAAVNNAACDATLNTGTTGAASVSGGPNVTTLND